jgi:anti-sigma factor RsiW
MNCERSELVHALIDGELDAGHAREVEAHIAQCPRCAAAFKQYRELGAAVIQADLRYDAPVALRRRIEAALPRPAPVASRRTLLKGFTLGMALSGAVAAGGLVLLVQNDRDQRLEGDLISAHLRSLQGSRLIDIESTDQHTVKPWFNGKLDVAPPVVDLTAKGFTLLGGRIDYLDGKAVAALVYKRRKHIINLFVEPGSATTVGRSARIAALQGFNIRHWRENGFDFWAVSDINADELNEFGNEIAAALRPRAGA